MVRRLVEKQQCRATQQELRERDAHLPAAGERLGRPVEVCFRKSQTFEHLGHAQVDAVALLAPEELREVVVPDEQRLVLPIGKRRIGECVLDPLDLRPRLEQGLERQGRLVLERAARMFEPVLWEVTDGEARGFDDVAGVGFVEAGEDAEERGLARTVRSRQADTITIVDLPGDVVEQDTVAESFRQAGKLDHSSEWQELRITLWPTRCGVGGVRMRPSEWKAVWQGVRTRGWTGWFVVLLLAIALAANAVMFAFADSLVFRPAPFGDTDRIVNLSGQVKPPERLNLSTSPVILEAWSKQTDLVSAVGGYLTKTIFLTGSGPLERVRTADITLEFLDVLGVSPRWGRGFSEGDDRDPSAFAVIISEDLARRRFGAPSRAPGQSLDATAGKLVVVGVMDHSFVFPDANVHIWRALDLRGPLTRNFGGVSPIARLTATAPVDRVLTGLVDRAAQVGAAAGLSTYTVRPAPLFRPAPSDRQTLVLILMGAALSLLLATCANVASLELATTLRRARNFAVQLALGASRAGLARIVALEGLILVMAALLGAYALARLSTAFLEPNLPDRLRLVTRNPIDVDGRALAGMAVFAALAWIAGALPAVLAARRTGFVSLLKVEDRGAAASRAGARLRRVLTVCQIALALGLVVNAVLFSRSYQRLLAVDKGFDSSGIFDASWMLPPSFLTGPARDAFIRDSAAALRGLSGVEGVTSSAPPPSTGNSPSQIDLETDAGVVASKILVGANIVDADYFSVIRLPLRQGRYFQSGDSSRDVVVPESFANRAFGGANAVGRSFRTGPQAEWLTVVGVVGDFRTERTRMPQATDRQLMYFALRQPRPSPPQPAGPPEVDTGGSTMYLSLTVRMSDRSSVATLRTFARGIDSRIPVTVTPADQDYADLGADTRLASQIVATFGGLAFLIAMAGVYAVMSFLVAGRTREIGIRIALGADPSSVRSLVLGSSLRLVGVGVVLGAALALGASRWIESQLFGISATDGLTILGAMVSLVFVGAVASWYPARRASEVDPAVTLRHD